jgi:hypothetical protein
MEIHAEKIPKKTIMERHPDDEIKRLFKKRRVHDWQVCSPRIEHCRIEPGAIPT